MSQSLSISSALDPERLLPFAAELADTAHGLSRHWFRHKLAVALKADQSAVTIADREIEVAIREWIEKAFPDHGIFGEETGRERREADAVWVIDPIDGTPV